MFGIIVSGRLVQTQFEQISETKFVTTILEADNVNHIVVFLTGVMPFPEGTAGQVYFSWPDPSAPPNWQLLGHISNNKPSVIFKISTLKKLNEIDNFNNVNTFGQQAICHNAQIGISIEPLTNVQDMPQNDYPDMYTTFAQKMLENFMNYVLSFSTTQSQMMPNPSTSYVPLSAVQNWYTNFERRLTQNPNFWKT
ncbi:hypothetical protein Trydic_g5268 [Trypoxylus dichotomus]